MKRIFLLFVLAACGGDTSGNDAGTNDAGNDATQSKDSSSTDSSSSDSSSTDASNDVTSGGDGGLGVGDTCDPQNNQCEAGLLCCSEPIHGSDAATSGYFCEKPVNKGCPQFP